MKKIIKIMMLIISLTLIAGIAQFDLSQAANKGVKISKKHFPDPYFRKAVKKYYDYNKDGYQVLVKTNLENITEILITNATKTYELQFTNVSICDNITNK